jgi:spore maturation protein CgeB
MKSKIKNILKRSKFISDINANIKCKRLKKLYKSLVDRYENKKQKYTLEELMFQKGFTQEWKDSLKNKRLNIFFIGTDEFQDKSGFIQDLSRLSNLSYFTKYDGSYGQYSGQLIYNNTQGKILNTNKVIEDIEKLISINQKPDIVLMQAWGRSFDIDKIKLFKEKNDLKFINIALDDRLVYIANTPKDEKYNYGISGLNSIVDLSLVSNPEVVEWYLKENIPAIFFPMASSREFYFPMDIEKKYDVGFIGNKYGYREELVSKLIEAGIKVEARGTGWKAGRIKLEDNNKFFNECKIILGIGTVGHCKDFYTQKLRDFDATLSGGVYVTHNNKDLKELFIEDEEIILCNNIDEYIEKIKVLLGDEEKLKEIASNAFQKASQSHTYKKRFIELFKFLGIQNEIFYKDLK